MESPCQRTERPGRRHGRLQFAGGFVSKLAQATLRGSEAPFSGAVANGAGKEWVRSGQFPTPGWLRPPALVGRELCRSHHSGYPNSTERKAMDTTTCKRSVVFGAWAVGMIFVLSPVIVLAAQPTGEPVREGAAVSLGPAVLYTGDCRDADFDKDGDVDVADYAAFEKTCDSGPAIPYTGDCSDADFDKDGDVDQEDFGWFQRCLGTAPPRGHGPHPRRRVPDG